MIHRFWSDDLDMDLPKVIPEVDEALAAAAGIRLWTHAHTSHGRLNHPSVWNTYAGTAAWFGTDPSGTGKPESYWTDSPIVECTWREAVRDAWPHSYLILVNGVPVWHADRLSRVFELLMYDLRGWRALPAGQAAKLRSTVLAGVRAATLRLTELTTTKES